MCLLCLQQSVLPAMKHCLACCLFLHLAGWGGKNCEEPFEQFCFNQCNGRGECRLGYCRCLKGW